jgi:hypothetical protein
LGITFPPHIQCVLIELANYVKTIDAHPGKTSYLETPTFRHEVYKFVAVFIDLLNASTLRTLRGKFIAIDLVVLEFIVKVWKRVHHHFWIRRPILVSL